MINALIEKEQKILLINQDFLLFFKNYIKNALIEAVAALRQV